MVPCVDLQAIRVSASVCTFPSIILRSVLYARAIDIHILLSIQKTKFFHQNAGSKLLLTRTPALTIVQSLAIGIGNGHWEPIISLVLNKSCFMVTKRRRLPVVLPKSPRTGLMEVTVEAICMGNTMATIELARKGWQ